MAEGGKAGEVLASRKNDLTVVAQDRNWRTYVAKELKDADQWASDWGFLSASSDGKSTHIIDVSIIVYLIKYFMLQLKDLCK